MIVMQHDGARGHSAHHQHLPDILERGGGSPGVRCIDRHFGDDGASAFANPVVGQSRHVRTLRQRQAGARVADEHDDRAVGFRDGDRVTQAIVVGHAAGDDRLRRRAAGTEQSGKADERAEQVRPASAIVCWSVGHSVPRIRVSRAARLNR